MSAYDFKVGDLLIHKSRKHLIYSRSKDAAGIIVKINTHKESAFQHIIIAERLQVQIYWADSKQARWYGVEDIENSIVDGNTKYFPIKKA